MTLREYLTLMDDFYYLSRAALVKDERNLDKFDRVFGHVFKGLDLIEQALNAENTDRVAEKTNRKIPH